MDTLIHTYSHMAEANNSIQHPLSSRKRLIVMQVKGTMTVCANACNILYCDIVSYKQRKTCSTVGCSCLPLRIRGFDFYPISGLFPLPWNLALSLAHAVSLKHTSG